MKIPFTTLLMTSTISAGAHSGHSAALITPAHLSEISMAEASLVIVGLLLVSLVLLRVLFTRSQ